MPRSLDESTSNLEDVLPDVLDRVSELERRVAALENRPEPLPVLTTPELPHVPAGVIPILGLALLGLAGAYLLRAIAESATAPRIVTVIAALVYAAAWLFSSIRTGTFPAVIYTVTSALILAPLLWETTVRFQMLSTAASAAILVVFVIAGSALAWRSGRVAITRITMLAGAGTALVLLMATHDLAPFIIALLAMALVAEYAACRDRFLGERWIAALPIDVSLLVLTYIVTRPQGLPEGYRSIPAMLTIAILAAPLAIYLAGIAFRTVARGLKITWFEADQTTAMFAISIGGALQITRGMQTAVLGAFCMLIGAGAYLAAFVLLNRQTERRSLHTYAFWGLTLLLAGTAILFSGTLLTTIWGALAALAMSVGRRTGHIFPRAQACVYLIGAVLISGLLQYCYAASVEPGTTLAGVAPAAILAAFAAAVCYAASGAIPTTPGRIPAAIIAGLLCWSMLAFSSGMLASMRIDANALPALRTTLLCAAAIGMVLAGSRWKRGELLWLQYPVMLLGAAKLLLEDFPHGRPATLALSLLSYGGALILLPPCRLGAQRRRA